MGSADPALPKYLDQDLAGGITQPRNLAACTYVHNNPVKLTDPTGEWPGEREPWSYDYTFHAEGDAADTHVLMDPNTGKFFSQVDAGGAPNAVGKALEIVTVQDAWNALKSCYNCTFPITGAPKQMSKVGDDLPLTVGPKGSRSR